MVVDPTRWPRLDPALVAAGLGLTPMESRVAVLLTEGKSLREVAAATGRKETTIRWHLRQIFAKRGIARQAELVRLVLSLAGAAHGPRSRAVDPRPTRRDRAPAAEPAAISVTASWDSIDPAGRSSPRFTRSSGPSVC